MTDQTSPASEERELLALTVEQHKVKRRIDLLRARIDERIRTEWQEKGHAPTWKYRGLGQIRLDGCDAEPKPYVANDADLASYIAERWPAEVTATVTVPADRLPEVLEALAFLGLEDGVTSTVAARPQQVSHVLKDVTLVDLADRDGLSEEEARRVPAKWIAVDSEGTEVPGVSGMAGAAPTLKVVVDRPVKAAAETEVDQQFLETHPATDTTSTETTETTETASADVDDVAKGA